MQKKYIALFLGFATIIGASCFAMKGPAAVSKKPAVEKKAPAAETTQPAEKKDYFFRTISAIKNGEDALVRKNVLADLEMVKRQDSAGITLLGWAVQMGSLDLVKFLVENGADVNTPDNKMTTPLAKAIVMKGNEDIRNKIIDYLVSEKGAVYAKVDVMFAPPHAYRYNLTTRKMAGSPPEALLYLPESMRNKVMPIEDQDVHMSLIYLSIPIRYYTQEGAKYTDQVKEIVEKITKSVREAAFKKKIFALKKGEFKRQAIKVLGAFVVASYSESPQLSKMINDEYISLLQLFPYSRATYTKEEANPHMSIARLMKGQKFDPEEKIAQEEFLKKAKIDEGLIGNSIDDISIMVSARVPSRFAADGFIACSGSPAQCK